MTCEALNCTLESFLTYLDPFQINDPVWMHVRPLPIGPVVFYGDHARYVDPTNNQELVLARYPDATVMKGAMTANFMIVSGAWWPGCIGWGSTRARAWKDAANAIRKQIKQVC